MLTEVTEPEQHRVTALELGRLLAHDCRTPLHAISGFTGLMLGSATGPLGAAVLEYVRQIAQAGRALEDALILAQQLVELEGILSTPVERRVDLGEILRELGFDCGDEATAGSLPLVPGDCAAWWRIDRMCRDYLQSGDGAPLIAQAHYHDGDGLELELRRADLCGSGYVGALATDLVRRTAACQGAHLRLVGREAIVLEWRLLGDFGR